MNRTGFSALLLSALLLVGCGTSGGNASAAPAPPSSGVQVDWSKLEQDTPIFQADRDGGRWYAGAAPELIPSEEYGPLVSYVGSMAYSFDTWTDSEGQEQVFYSEWGTSLYGLMTKEGKLVTDPVYLSVVQPDFHWQGKATYLPVLVLTQAREEWQDSNNGRRCCVAALDGSWCTDFEFWLYTAREDELLLVGPKGLTWMDAVSGNRMDWSWEFLGISETELPQVMEHLMWVIGLEWIDIGVFLGAENPQDWENSNVRIFQPETLEVSWMPMSEYNAALEQWYDQRHNVPNAIYWDHEIVDGKFVLTTGERRYVLTTPIVSENMGQLVMGDLAIISDWSGDRLQNWLFRLSDCSLLYEGEDISFLYDPAIENPAPYVCIRSGGKSILYAPDLTPLTIHHPMESDTWIYHSIRDGLVFVQDYKTFFACYDCHTGACIFYRNLTLGD